MRMISGKENNLQKEARDVHKKTGCVCKNCEYFHKTGEEEIIGVYGECRFHDYTNGDNYCMFFRFR